jgi:hypothetical protein
MYNTTPQMHIHPHFGWRYFLHHRLSQRCLPNQLDLIPNQLDLKHPPLACFKICQTTPLY